MKKRIPITGMKVWIFRRGVLLFHILHKTLSFHGQRIGGETRMGDVSKFKIWKKGQYKGVFVYFRRISLTLFLDPDGNVHKPKLSFLELLRLYKQSEEYKTVTRLDPLTRLEVEGRITL